MNSPHVAGIDRIGRLRSPEYESFAWHCSLSLLRQSLPLKRSSLRPPPLFQFQFSNLYFPISAATSRPRLAASAVLRTPACVSTPAASSVPRTSDTALPANPHRPPRTARWMLLQLWPTGNISRHFNRIVSRTPLLGAAPSRFSAFACKRNAHSALSGQPASGGDFVFIRTVHVHSH